MVLLTALKLGAPLPILRLRERHVFELHGTAVSSRLQQFWLSRGYVKSVSLSISAGLRRSGLNQEGLWRCSHTVDILPGRPARRVKGPKSRAYHYRRQFRSCESSP